MTKMYFIITQFGTYMLYNVFNYLPSLETLLNAERRSLEITPDSGYQKFSLLHANYTYINYIT
jgi:hypothetical protein